MEQKDTKILMIAGLIFLLSIGVIYFLAMPAYKQLGVQDVQIEEIKSQIEARNNYYTVVESKVKTLEDAGWAEKKKTIEVNFTSSPFFVSKMTVFFRTMAAGSGMTVSSITASTPNPLKTVVAPTTSSEVKISKTTGVDVTDDVQQKVVATNTYFDKLQGSVKATTFNIAVSGTYNSFKKFLSDLENQTRIVTVKSVALSSSQLGSEGKKLTNLPNFNLVVDVYSY